MGRKTIRWATVGAGIIGLSVCTQQATKVAQPPPASPPEATTGKPAHGTATVPPRKVVPLPAEKPDPPSTTNPVAEEQERSDDLIHNVLPKLREKIGPPVHRQGDPILETDTNYMPP
jgi:hypothetical protein